MTRTTAIMNVFNDTQLRVEINVIQTPSEMK